MLKDAFNKMIDDGVSPIIDKIEDLIRIPIVGRIVAGLPVPVPASDLSYFNSEISH